MKPFLKWAGGKRWLVAKHADLLPPKVTRLVEPFLGSGAVFFHLEPSKAVLSDSNNQLIETYVILRSQPEQVHEALRSHQAKHSPAHYYRMRASAPETDVERAARFMYLNRTCFNALYRVNRRGEFNVPKGSKDTVLLPGDDFSAWAKALECADLVAQDFANTIAQAEEGDLLYVDPPYTVKHNNNNFVKYNEHIFSWADQERLAVCLSDATQRGVRVLLSNANHVSVADLYSSSEWTQLVLDRHSVLASSASSRKPTTELVISNFLTRDGDMDTPRACV